MKTQAKPHDGTAALQVMILHEQERAAKFARTGNVAKARAARCKPLILLNQLDLKQLFALQA
jgi:hypothetical protein